MNNPIGIFDSGIGGISILEKLENVLPFENFIYLADNDNCPYGNKSKEEIIKFSFKNCEKLIELNCKIIIVACNTATTNSINFLRSKISIPIIGIEPGLKPAIIHTKTKNIGVLATEQTLDSNLFFETLAKNKIEDIKIHEQVGFDLVKMIENGEPDENKLYNILQNYLSPMIDKNIDCLVLGCTHYHYIIDTIKKIIPKNIQLIDTITPVTNHTINILKLNNLINTSNEKRYVKVFFNGNNLSRKFIGDDYKIRYLKF